MKRLIACACLAACTAIAGPSFAQGYAGASLGESDMNLDCAGTADCDNTGSAYKIFGGYDFTPNVGIEVAWLDLGKGSATVPMGPFFGTATAVIKVTGVAVYAVGRMPAGSVLLFGKLGAASLDADADVRLGGATGSDSQTSTNAAFGIGAEYAFTRAVSGRLEWERFRAKLGDEGFDVDLFSVGALFRF